jgi:biotin-dependent carboxylase-like uncharacterized protein
MTRAAPQPVCRILAVGAGLTFQDRGRPGWRRFGIPPGGVMDPQAAAQANLLAGNPPDFPVLELALQGAELLLLREAWLAVAGAEAGCVLPAGSGARLPAGTRLAFPRNRGGLWTYVAVAGGWACESWLGSASAYPRGGLGALLLPGNELRAAPVPPLPSPVVRRFLRPKEHRNYLDPAPFLLEAGPQAAAFTPEARRRLVETPWTVSARSDRTGFRLEGPALQEAFPEITSEPVLPGSLQIPGDGRPIVTMPDGPTVGGYPKIAWLAAEDLGRFAQCRPGTQVRFAWKESFQPETAV